MSPTFDANSAGRSGSTAAGSHPAPPPETVALRPGTGTPAVPTDEGLSMESATGFVDRPTPVLDPGRTPPPAAITPAPELGLLSDFGKYELMGELGRGGMGVVYKARHKELDRVVTIKMILASHLATPEQVERFYDEARAAARIRSPHIVGIHDVGQTNGQHYFAMDFVAGPSFAELIRAGPVASDQAARYVRTVARGVADLHALGVVHRDLKLSNVLLDEAGRPCVTDFGLAKILQADGRMTRTGAIVGTPGYMAPEQAAGRAGEVGPRSDLYSLGAILFELLPAGPRSRARRRWTRWSRCSRASRPARAGSGPRSRATWSGSA